MAKDVIHISEAEAASDFASLMERVRAGAEVVIEKDARPVAVLHAAGAVRVGGNGEPRTEGVEFTGEVLNGSKEFFAGRTLEQLAEAQGAGPLERLSELAGGWPADDDVDEFVDATYRSRS
jgi:antitoxin (DNA-binding transcriptional repressor) of toxin-antitoxin stability system